MASSWRSLSIATCCVVQDDHYCTPIAPIAQWVGPIFIRRADESAIVDNRVNELATKNRMSAQTSSIRLFGTRSNSLTRFLCP